MAARAALAYSVSSFFSPDRANIMASYSPPPYAASSAIGHQPYAVYSSPNNGKESSNRLVTDIDPEFGMMGDDHPQQSQNGPLPHIAQCSKDIRLGFVRKVYGILSLQLFLTTFICLLFYNVPVLRSLAQRSTVFYIVNLVLSLVFLVAAILRRRSYPANVILLTLFTLFMSFGVATVVTFYSTLVVLEALSITLAIFISLTLFTIFSKRDFSGMGPFLYVILLCIVFTSFVHMILVLGFGIYSSVLDIVISVVSSIVFSLYIVYDTYMIFNRYSPEDYVPAVLDLYLDVVNLFLSLLRLLGHTQD